MDGLPIPWFWDSEGLFCLVGLLAPGVSEFCLCALHLSSRLGKSLSGCIRGCPEEVLPCLFTDLCSKLHAPLKCKGAWETWSSDRKGNKMLGRPRVLSQAFWGHILKGLGHEKITKDGVLYLVNGKRYALIFLDELIFSAFQLTVRNWICGTQWQGMWLTNVLILGLTGEYVFKSPFSF